MHRRTVLTATCLAAHRIRLFPIALIAALGAVSAAAQTPRPDSAPLARQAFEHGAGRVVGIDEAHRNTHTYANGDFRGLVELLQRDGYLVRPFADAVTSSSLTGIDVLIISGPGGWTGPEASLTAAEVASLMQWIRSGGSLLLILDHMPAPQNAATLTRALGVTDWHDGYAMVAIPEASPIGPIIFWQADAFPAGAPQIGPTGPGGGKGYQGTDAVMAKHSITLGRSHDELVRSVATFTGSAFRPPPGAEALLTMPGRAISLRPAETPNAMPTFTADTPRVPVGGWLQGAVMRLGQGRVALFGETGLFSGGPAANNRTFALNVLHWLTGLL